MVAKIDGDKLTILKRQHYLFAEELNTYVMCCNEVHAQQNRTVARLHGEFLILGDFNAPRVNWLTRSCSMANSFSNQLLTAAKVMP